MLLYAPLPPLPRTPMIEILGLECVLSHVIGLQNVNKNFSGGDCLDQNSLGVSRLDDVIMHKVYFPPNEFLFKSNSISLSHAM